MRSAFLSFLMKSTEQSLKTVPAKAEQVAIICCLIFDTLASSTVASFMIDLRLARKLNYYGIRKVG